MDALTPETVSNAFTQMNEKKSWRSRIHGDTVHFSSVNGMLTLLYHTKENRFAVKFQRFQGAWGDYINAIARSLFHVLNTLKAAGLPFEAPGSMEGCLIRASTGADGRVWAEWEGLNAAPNLTPQDVVEALVGPMAPPEILPPIL